jgi:hypothetical protein
MFRINQQNISQQLSILLGLRSLNTNHPGFPDWMLTAIASSCRQGCQHTTYPGYTHLGYTCRSPGHTSHAHYMSWGRTSLQAAHTSSWRAVSGYLCTAIAICAGGLAFGSHLTWCQHYHAAAAASNFEEYEYLDGVLPGHIMAPSSRHTCRGTCKG